MKQLLSWLWNVRIRLTLLYTGISLLFFATFGYVVNHSSKSNREKEFYELLSREATTKANLFFQANVADTTLHAIYRNNRSLLNEVEVAIFDQNFELLYHDAVDIDFVKEDEKLLRSIFDEGDVKFYIGDWQVRGQLVQFGGERYAVTAAAFDEFGFRKIDNLRNVTLLVTIISLILSLFVGYFFTRNALSPISKMSQKARQISATSLNLRLPVGKTKDELHELGQTFNHMLERLEQSFLAQRQFTSNVAHELRTPLAALKAELELLQQTVPAEHPLRLPLQQLGWDVQQLVTLTNQLLDMARVNYHPSELNFDMARPDEVLTDAWASLKAANPNYVMRFQVVNDFGDEIPEIQANEYLLRIAFANVLDNACKFSEDSSCFVMLSVAPNGLELEFADNGQGISEADQKQLFTPFFRGKNTGNVRGHGIGLFLARKIIEVHSGQFSLTSTHGVGTKITIFFPLGASPLRSLGGRAFGSKSSPAD